MDTLSAISARKSIRAYTRQNVSHEDIESILESASGAPSGVNSQPWHVSIVQGHTKMALTEALIAARTNQPTPTPDYQYYPDNWSEPYKSRRISCGKALYKALNISHEDKQRKLKAWENNYRFFGAPIGLFFFVDKHLSKGSWVDMGMFIQTVMIAATAKGLATCAQASLAEFPHIVRDILKIDDQYLLISGMCLGYADTTHAVNQYQLPRESPTSFTQWYD